MASGGIGLVAIVLAAGKSSRMGCPKLLLPFGGRPALDRVLATCRRGGVDQVHVVLGEHAEAIQQEADLEHSEVVLNPDPTRGMSSSIREGLRALRQPVEGFFIFPADHPLVPVRVIREMIQAFRQLGEECSIVTPVYTGKRGHPVLFRGSLIDDFLALGPDEPGYTVIRSRADEVFELPVDTPFVANDMDTPEDYVRLRAAFSSTDVL